jgi:hypothetical protein
VKADHRAVRAVKTAVLAALSAGQIIPDPTRALAELRGGVPLTRR